jgi:hypothetical protein
MGLLTKKNIIKYAAIVVFIGLLALPIFLESMSNHKEGTVTDAAQEQSMKMFGFSLEEVSESSGINFSHLSPLLDPAFLPILPEVASMGASVSIADFDQDGWNDVYVTNSRYGSKNSLFHNQKDGSFVDVAKQLGVGELNVMGSGVSMGSVWADYDNDGFEDLLVYKWGRPEIFRNEQGKGFTNVTNKSGLPRWINANTALWLDYNSDGLVDLFIGGYFPEDLDLWDLKQTSVLTESFEYAQNGGRNFLFENAGDGTFLDVTEKVGLTSTRWTLAGGAVDVDLDGYPELIVANDYGTDEFYYNDGGKRFIEQGKETAVGFSPKSGMNVTFGDVYNNGQLGIYISNITEEGVLLQGNNFWVPKKENGKLSYQNLARKSGIESGGWSYGAQFGDLNNDGFMDLFVANGFISGQKGTSYWYDFSKVTAGNASIISDIKNWPPMYGRSHSGYQQNRIWINTGSGYFYDVAEYVTGNQTFDGRSVAMADLWNRGVLDVMVANQNGRLLVYRNDVVKENQWIAFELKGTKNNRSAIGAMVKLTWDSNTQSQVISGGIGFSSQNQRRIQFGLGQSTSIDKVEIYWPDGYHQVIEHPEVSKVHLIEESR